jgi:hypothetical protein
MAPIVKMGGMASSQQIARVASVLDTDAITAKNKARSKSTIFYLFSRQQMAAAGGGIEASFAGFTGAVRELLCAVNKLQCALNELNSGDKTTSEPKSEVITACLFCNLPGNKCGPHMTFGCGHTGDKLHYVCAAGAHKKQCYRCSCKGKTLRCLMCGQPYGEPCLEDDDYAIITSKVCKHSGIGHDCINNNDGLFSNCATNTPCRTNPATHPCHACATAATAANAAK